MQKQELNWKVSNLLKPLLDESPEIFALLLQYVQNLKTNNMRTIPHNSSHFKYSNYFMNSSHSMNFKYSMNSSHINNLTYKY
jgi:hypothetical protein